MKSTCPEIHAVAQVAVQKDGVWVSLPPEPWPPFVRLSPDATEEEVALVIGTLSCYGRSEESPAQSAEVLANSFPEVLPGGFAVVGSDRTVFPSCCCGLETWADWLKVLDGGGAPWMGHDPSPLVEVLEGHVYVWSDGALGRKPESESPLTFTSDQFDHAVRRAANDIAGFVLPLRSWLEIHAPRAQRRLFRDSRMRSSAETCSCPTFMTCDCANLPDLFKLESRPELETGTDKIAAGNWVRLHKCRSCGQLWRIDELDKYQTQFAVRVPSGEAWEAFDAAELQKQFLVSSRGGLSDAICVWSGCDNPQVKGVVYCADHLFQTGARE